MPPGSSAPADEHGVQERQPRWSAAGPASPAIAVDTLTALYYPETVDASILGRIGQFGVIVAGGLHPEIKTRYFRVGHMGAVNEADILTTVGALESALSTTPAKLKTGIGLEAAARILFNRPE
jgi:alanine-glyoxylate transaminase/serine-glyoxylate transaminase/serine-pyruvate transaminase